MAGDDVLVYTEDEELEIHFNKSTLLVEGIYFYRDDEVERTLTCSCGRRFTYADEVLLCEHCNRTFSVDDIKAMGEQANADRWRYIK